MVTQKEPSVLSYMDGAPEGPDGWEVLSLHGFGETMDDLTVDVLNRLIKKHIYLK